MTIPIPLPWPPTGLNPNNARRLHWSKRAKMAKRYRQDCGWACKAAGVRAMVAAPVTLAITFHPPDNAARDLDNMLASIKAGLDAISDAIGIDDKLFGLTIARGTKIAGGLVSVVVIPAWQQVSGSGQLLSEQVVA